MGEAREIMDRVTQAIFSKDMKAAAKLYASDAVALTPDRGEVRGNENIVAWASELFDVSPDARYEMLNSYEAGNTVLTKATLRARTPDPCRTLLVVKFPPQASPCDCLPAISQRSRTSSSQAITSTTIRWHSWLNSG